MTQYKSIRIVGILDELSSYFFSLTCDFCNLDIHDYKEQLESSRPIVLLVESAWKGKEDKWYRKISTPCKELIEILSWCKENQVPTIFWNKEDPVHFGTFLRTASLFDWVFTTDLDCVPMYKKLLQHDQVGVLPFATSLQAFNPINTRERQKRFTFAGAYYRRQKQRTKDFEEMYQICEQFYPVDIYARDPYPGNPDYTFPEKYKKSIVTSLPIDQVENAYKSYEYGITLNTVKDSFTMESRRVFELASCNTLVISNECKGVRNFFGELVLYYENSRQLQAVMERIKKEPEIFHKLKLAALRKVISQHTYEKRIQYLLRKVAHMEIREYRPKVLVLSDAKTEQEKAYIQNLYSRQQYQNKELVYIDEADNQEGKVTQCGTADYYAFFSSDNYYGEYYITDCILALKYVTADIIGKGHYYTYKNGRFSICGNSEYQYTKEWKRDRCIMSANIAEDMKLNDKEGTEEVGTVFGIDAYNFCEHYVGEYCEPVDDYVCNQGYDIEEIMEMKEGYIASKDIHWEKQFTPEDLFHMQAIGSNQQIEAYLDTNGYYHIKADMQRIQNMYVNTNILLNVDQYAKENIIKVYMRGRVKGNAKCMLKFLNKNKNYLKMFKIEENSYWAIPVPGGSTYCTLCYMMSSNTEMIIEEIGLNMYSKRGIV